MSEERIEQLAALKALGLLDEAGMQELRSAAETSPEARALVRDLEETAALLAYEPATKSPPEHLRAAILRQLPAREAAVPARGTTERNRLVGPRWALALAAALAAAVVIWQAVVNARLQGQVRDLRAALAAAQAQPPRENPPGEPLQLAALEPAPGAKAEAALASSRILVAWDAAQHRGVISLKNLPPAPAGKDYQLWVLDPQARGPLNAGVVAASRSFAVKQPGSPGPQFAISLEPTGGSPAPTGPILFVSAAEK